MRILKICRYDKNANPYSCGGCKEGCIERKPAIINEEFEKVVREMEEQGIKHNCKTCGWGREIQKVKTIMKCGCPLSGSFNTDVVENDSCDRWKKASYEYLKAIGELK